tara:strand:- start:150 stop:506 length:357 start_codon:yes stop_codon:yes gene_type:complete
MCELSNEIKHAIEKISSQDIDLRVQILDDQMIHGFMNNEYVTMESKLNLLLDVSKNPYDGLAGHRYSVETVRVSKRYLRGIVDHLFKNGIIECSIWLDNQFEDNAVTIEERYFGIKPY